MIKKIIIGTICVGTLIFSTIKVKAQDYSEDTSLGFQYSYTTDYLNVRTEPYYGGEIIGILAPNSKIITRQGESEYWDVITLDDEDYFIHTAYIAEEITTDCSNHLITSKEDLYLEYISPQDNYLGQFNLTAYCPCSKCCGWNGCITSSGTYPVEGRTVACNVLPAGTKIIIDEKVYTVEDTGNLGKNTIDIYMESHDDALEFGIKKNVDVYLVEE